MTPESSLPCLTHSSCASCKSPLTHWLKVLYCPRWPTPLHSHIHRYSMPMSVYRGETEGISHAACLETRKHQVINVFLHRYPSVFYCSPETLPPEAPPATWDQLREPQLLLFHTADLDKCPLLRLRQYAIRPCMNFSTDHKGRHRHLASYVTHVTHN